MARQVTADSAVELVQHPLRCGRNVVAETTAHAVAAGAGVFEKRVALPLRGRPGPICPVPRDAPMDTLDEELHGPPDGSHRPAHFELHPDPEDALAALHRLIDAASHRIDVHMFLWESDQVGAAVAEWLTARAAAGVHVRVLIDGGGNLVFAPLAKKGPDADVNRVVCALAKQPNVEVVRIRTPFCRFDHRKLVLIDGRTAWAGGRNFTHRSFFCQRDLSFTLTGPLVDDLRGCFEAAWVEQGGCEEEAPGFASTESPPPPNAMARLVHTGPACHQLAPALYRAVDEAKHHVVLENGYLSDARLVCKLARARRRGVDVRVVMTLESQETAVDRANRVTANRLLAAGVRVYLYPKMTHAKVAVVDSCWAYLGTGNCDALSLRHNCEFGLIIGAGPLVRELEERVFRCDLCPDWELMEPLKLSLGDYACEFLMCLCL